MTTAARSDRASAERLVALLRAELGSAAPPLTDSVAATDWQALEQTAEMHGLTPFLERLLAPFSECVPKDTRERFALRAIGNRLRNRIVGGLLREIDASFAAAKTPVVLLKGAALLHSLYGDAGPRPLSDIDVLVCRGELDVARRALRTIGFTPADERDEHFFRRDMHTVFHRPLLRSIPVEMHWDLTEPYRPYAFDLNAIWAGTRSVGSDWRVLRMMSDEHTLAYLCLHLERHALVYRHVLDRDDWFDVVTRGGAGARLIWLYDVALAVQRWGSTLDWDRLVECSNLWAIAPSVRAALEICRRVLLVEPPKNVTERLHGRRAGLVESVASRALVVRSSDGSRATQESGHTYRNATLALNVSGFLTPSAAYLRRRYGVGTRLSLLRLRHLVAAAAAIAHALHLVLGRATRTWRSTRTAARHGQQGDVTAAKRTEEAAYPQANPQLMVERVRTGLAVYDPEHNATHHLNSPAARVLALCDGSRSAGAIAVELRRQLDAGPGLTDADVDAAVDRFLREGLVTVEAEPPRNRCQ